MFIDDKYLADYWTDWALLPMFEMMSLKEQLYCLSTMIILRCNCSGNKWLNITLSHYRHVLYHATLSKKLYKYNEACKIRQNREKSEVI